MGNEALMCFSCLVRVLVAFPFPCQEFMVVKSRRKNGSDILRRNDNDFELKCRTVMKKRGKDVFVWVPVGSIDPKDEQFQHLLESLRALPFIVQSVHPVPDSSTCVLLKIHSLSTPRTMEQWRVAVHG